MAGYIIYLVYFILAFASSTAGTVLIPGVVRLGVLGSCLFLLAMVELYHLLIKKDYQVEDWIFASLTLFLMILGLKNGAGTQAGIYFVIFGMRRLRFVRLAWITLVIGLVLLIITMVAAAQGYIAYYPFYEWVDGVHLMRRALGFTFVLFPPAVWANLEALYLYLRKTKISCFELLVLIYLNVWFYSACMGELSYVSGIAFLAAGLIWKTWGVVKNYIGNRISQREILRNVNSRSKIYSTLCVLAGSVYPISTLVSFLIVYFYQPDNEFLEKINQLSKGRISLPKEAISEYGLHLFGRKIEWVGAGIDPFRQTTGVYNYVDNLYIHVALQYGLIALVLMVVIASLVMIYLVRRKEWYLAFVMLVLAGHGMVDDLILYFQFNGFLLLGGKAFDLIAEWRGKPYHWEERERSDHLWERLFPRDSVRHHFLMNALLSISNFLFPLITFPYVSRILLPEGTGRVKFASSVIAVFAMIAQLGIPTYGIRACAQVRDSRRKLSETVRSLVSINLVTSLFAYLLLFVGTRFIPQLAEERSLIVLTSTMILFNTVGMEWLFKGLEQYTYITIRSVLFKLLALVLTFILVREQNDIMIYTALSVLASSASQVLNFFYARKFVDLLPVNSSTEEHFEERSSVIHTWWQDIQKHISPTIIFFAMAAATTIYTNLDVLMLRFMTNATEVGYYDAAIRIRAILLTVVASLGTVLMPRAAYLIEEKRYEEFKGILTRAMHYVLLTAIPLTLFFLVFGDKALILFSGEAYQPGITALRFLIPTIFLVGITNILGIQVLVPLGKEKQVLYSELAGGAVDFLLNLILIPRLASTGAAIGTLAAEFVVLVFQYISIRRLPKSINIMSALKNLPLAQIAFASAASIVAVWLISLVPGVNRMSLIVNIAAIAVAFAAIYLVLCIIMKDQLVMDGLHLLQNQSE